MAELSSTKLLLAASLKELMSKKPFEKINISEICESCNMNRKSFYYHFKDKYDLVNWIFDTEFSVEVNSHCYGDVWNMLTSLSCYFYENRSFYRKALLIRGQNSFSEHFRDRMLPFISERIADVFDKKNMEYQVVFFADAVVMAIQRWLIDKHSVLPEEFVRQVKLSIKYIAIRYVDLLTE